MLRVGNENMIKILVNFSGDGVDAYQVWDAKPYLILCVSKNMIEIIKDIDTLRILD